MDNFFWGITSTKMKHRTHKIENKTPFGYNLTKRSASGRELSPPHSSRISLRPVHPGVNRSKNTHRVSSLEDSYKAVTERKRPLTLYLKEVPKMFYIGIDWADDHHDIHIADDNETKVDSFRIKHDPEGLSCLRDKIRKLPVSKDQVLIAIETHKHLLVDFLLDEGYTIYSINPRSVDSYRDRYRVSGAKDDSFDAMVLANIIRTDRNQHRALMPNSDLARELKILTQDEQRLIRLKTKLLNQIQSCLKDYYPKALELFSEIDQAITLEFLIQFPQPKKIPMKDLKSFFKKRSYPNRDKKVQEIYDKLSEPHIAVEEFTVRAKSRMLVALVTQLKTLLPQLAQYQKEIKKLFEQHPDHDIFKNLPGAGDKTAPRLLSEIGDVRERYIDAKNLQCDAGTAPVTKSSGKLKIVHMRFACRRSFKNVLYQFAFSSTLQSVWAKNFYDKQRFKNNTHSKALRALGNKWLEIIFHLWKTHAIYNENVHLANITRYQLEHGSITA